MAAVAALLREVRGAEEWLAAAAETRERAAKDVREARARLAAAGRAGVTAGEAAERLLHIERLCAARGRASKEAAAAGEALRAVAARLEAARGELAAKAGERLAAGKLLERVRREEGTRRERKED